MESFIMLLLCKRQMLGQENPRKRQGTIASAELQMALEQMGSHFSYLYLVICRFGKNPSLTPPPSESCFLLQAIGQTCSAGREDLYFITFAGVLRQPAAVESACLERYCG